jgi:hypothetical protein
LLGFDVCALCVWMMDDGRSSCCSPIYSCNGMGFFIFALLSLEVIECLSNWTFGMLCLVALLTKCSFGLIIKFLCQYTYHGVARKAYPLYMSYSDLDCNIFWNQVCNVVQVVRHKPDWYGLCATKFVILCVFFWNIVILCVIKLHQGWRRP